MRGTPKVKKAEEVEEKEGIKWLHQGIRKSEFTLSFTLEHRIIIQQANLANGLLILYFSYDVPEQEKPQQIAIEIQNQSASVLEHSPA